MEEDLGLCNLASENDQRTSVSFCHLELIRFELGFLGKLDDDFLVPHPGFPMRMARCDERLSLGSRSDRNPGLCGSARTPKPKASSVRAIPQEGTRRSSC